MFRLFQGIAPAAFLGGAIAAAVGAAGSNSCFLAVAALLQLLLENTLIILFLGIKNALRLLECVC